MLPSCPSLHTASSGLRPRHTCAWAAPLVAAFLLAGCSPALLKPHASPAPPPVAVVEAPPPPESEADAEAETGADAPAKKGKKNPAADPAVLVLAQTDRTVRMAPADLAKEIARLNEREEASVENPLLLAVALAQTRQPVDTARALGLVQRVLGNNAPAAQPLHPLARLLESRLLQQRRLEDLLERQTQQLRDAQRRNEQLNERLEAVRAIERSLTTRPAP